MSSLDTKLVEAITVRATSIGTDPRVTDSYQLFSDNIIQDLKDEIQSKTGGTVTVIGIVTSYGSFIATPDTDLVSKWATHTLHYGATFPETVTLYVTLDGQPDTRKAYTLRGNAVMEDLREAIHHDHADDEVDGIGYYDTTGIPESAIIWTDIADDDPLVQHEGAELLYRAVTQNE